MPGTSGCAEAAVKGCHGSPMVSYGALAVARSEARNFPSMPTYLCEPSGATSSMRAMMSASVDDDAIQSRALACPVTFVPVDAAIIGCVSQAVRLGERIGDVEEG